MADGARVAVPASDDRHGEPVSGGPAWAQVKNVFHSALEQPEEQRSWFIADACGSDTALRAEVESLLRAHVAAGAFASGDAIASLTADSLHELSAADPALAPGARIGNYDIVGPVGRGSM